MATATYLPNTTGSTGWKGTTSNDEIDDYNATEENTTSTDDANHVDYQVAKEQATHKITVDVVEGRSTITNIAITCKVSDGTSGTKTLWIWNYNTSSWNSVDTDTGSGTVTLTATKTTNITYWIDAGGLLIFRAGGPTGETLAHYFGRVVITYVPPATQLIYTTHPVNTAVNATMANVVVEAWSASARDTNYTANIIVSLTVPGAATLSGTTTKAAAAGVSTFNDLAVDVADTYNMDADSGALPTEVSNAFDITSAFVPYPYPRGLSGGLNNTVTGGII